MNYDAQATVLKLLEYCRENGWAGYDPYDALNSRALKALPWLDSRWPRIALTQALKRSPVNIRAWALVPKTQNPKALALFLSGLLRLQAAGIGNQEQNIETMIGRLAALRSAGESDWCWGYSFPWQTRSIVVPAGSANLVCTTFVAGSLLDAYEERADMRCLEMAASAADYILTQLYWTGSGGLAGFSYPQPGVQGQVHNSNLLAAALLCRVAKLTGEGKYLDPALRVARYSAGLQRTDGSWPYGEASTQQWVDNFHTGFNLSALRSLERYTGSGELEPRVRRGFEFYRQHFFLPDGAVRYFHDRTYPIDAHCVAQSILTPLELADLDPGNQKLAESVFGWAMEHMWDERGFFYYRRLRLCTIRTPYMRWTEAWMFLALATLSASRKCTGNSGQPRNDATPAVMPAPTQLVQAK